MASWSNNAAVRGQVSSIGPASDVVSRRSRLVTMTNPNPRHDYVVTLSGELRLPALAVSISATLRYVPDGSVLQPNALGAYLTAIEGNSWQTLEDVATAVLTDVNNEIIPRWVHIHLSATGADGHGRHDIDVEDRQPNWENAGLIARLGAY